MALVDLEAYLAQQSQQGRFSGSVLLSQDRQRLIDRGYGAADRGTGRPNTPQTAFQICSVSKQFAAAAVLVLCEQGALSVQDRIRAWLPECPGEWEPITVHQLLTHTSGLGHWRDFPELNLFAPITRDHLLRLFYQRPLRFPPGSGWAYSSPGYVLVAHIVEQVSGEPYAAFLHRRIFQPLGMAHTGAGNRAPHPEQQACGYAGGEPVVSFELATVSIGAGDLWSTTRDLARWDAALATPGRLLSAASLQAMFTPHAAVPDFQAAFPGTQYGYGWYLAEVERRRVRYHPGDNPGFSSLNVQVPDRKALAILLSNDEHSDLMGISLRLVGALLGGDGRRRPWPLWWSRLSRLVGTLLGGHGRRPSSRS